MQLKLTNINKIKSATINLNGLTVVAGVNDSGKSTIGKMLFSLIKTIGNMSNQNAEERKKRIQQKAFYLYTTLLSLERKGLVDNVKSKLALPNTAKELVDELLDESSENKLLLARSKSLLDSLQGITLQQKARALRYLNALSIEVLEEKDPQKVFQKEFSFAIESEFLNSVCTHGTGSSEISFFEEDSEKEVSISLKHNKIERIKTSALADFYLNDATFVESPLYIHLLDVLTTAQTLKDRQFRAVGASLKPIVNYHIKDLAQKLDNIRYIVPNLEVTKARVTDIERITGGKFSFDSQSRNLYWERDGVNYSPVNVASGIKAFGVMQILLEIEAIDENKMLIWDEPENHLHPEWQIRFAQLFVELAKSGIPVLISSHSPYFIQAIRYFAEKYQLDKFVNYYLAEEDTNGLSTVEEVTKDLNRVFLKLAEPMNTIINLGM